MRRSVHPKPDDLLLLIEVVDTTAQFGQELKFPLYASYGELDDWLVSLNATLGSLRNNVPTSSVSPAC